MWVVVFCDAGAWTGWLVFEGNDVSKWMIGTDISVLFDGASVDTGGGGAVVGMLVLSGVGTVC